MQPTLFGQSCLMRGWDRIGKFGRRAMTTFDAEGATADALARNVGKKQRRGYVARPDE